MGSHFRESLIRDVRFAGRGLRRARRFSIPAVTTLGLGGGLGLAVLTLAHDGLRRSPSPPPDAGAPIWVGGWSPAARPVTQLQAEALDGLLWMLGAATLLVVLLACVNVGVLLLARAAARHHELSLRVVLGAGPGRMARQLVTEVLIFCLLGGTIGLMVTGAALATLHAGWPEGLPRWTSVVPSALASSLALGLPLAAVLLCGLLPVRAATRRTLATPLVAGDRATAGRHEGVLRRWLVTGAVAASVALLVGAGLLLRGFGGAGGQAPHQLGYDPRDTLTLQVTLAAATAADAGARRGAQHDVVQRLSAIPGVTAVGVAATDDAWTGLGVEDRVTAQCGDCSRGGMWLPVTTGVSRHQVVGPGFFAALGLPVLRGREFAATDGEGAPPVAVISRSFARLLFLGTDPVGKPVQVGGDAGGWYEVVGVVEDVRARGLGSSSEWVPALYLSSLQKPPPSVWVTLRTAGDPAAYADAATAAVASLRAGHAVSEVRTLEAHMARFGAPIRWFAGIFSSLAAFAALVAAIGLFGVVSFTVGRRTREIGVRIALGARPAHVVRLVVRQSMAAASLGGWLGLLAAFCVARLLEVELLGVRALDAPVYLATAVLLLLVALAASAIPARRAAAVDPAIALRGE